MHHASSTAVMGFSLSSEVSCFYLDKRDCFVLHYIHHLNSVRRRAEVMATTEKQGYFPRWSLKTEGIIAPDERLPWGQSIFVGLQHVLAMFGATVLAPIIMGFDPNTAIFFSGIGTLIFFLVVGGRVPSYLGSSFSFIAVVIAATGATHNIPVALGGIIAAGLLYAI